MAANSSSFFKRKVLTMSVVFLTLAGLLNFGGASPALAAPRLTGPVPQTPAGFIQDTTPTYTWDTSGGGTHFYIQVMHENAVVFSQIVATCGAATCSLTPATPLTQLPYKWRVKSRAGGVWGNFSGWEYFTVTAPAFDSQFTANASGWSPLNGAWSLASGRYTTSGLPNKVASIVHVGNYPTFIYLVRMKRTGCAGCGNIVFFRGSGVIGADGNWTNGYRFMYNNGGFYRFDHVMNGVVHVLNDWTAAGAINSDWNVIKVVANGDNIDLYINGTALVGATMAHFDTGRVGIGYSRDSSPGNKLFIDYAKLILSPPP